jgi:amidase
VIAFEPTMAPQVLAQPGDRITFCTLDACSGEVQSEHVAVPLDATYDPRRGGGNPASGPVAVEGAQPGDTLVVEILEIRLAPRGLLLMWPGIGPLGGQIDAPRTWIFELSDGVASRGELVIPLRPMIGVIGVATAGERVATELVGPHGGNLDNRHAAVGSTVLLPVRQPGALLAIGDVHAAMGDGEISCSGIEAAAEVTVELGLIAGRQSSWPIVETGDRWFAHGSAPDLSAAAQAACEEASSLLRREWGLSAAEAVGYLTAAGDVGVCQCCQPSPYPAVARVGVVRSETAPAAFRVESR